MTPPKKQTPAEYIKSWHARNKSRCKGVPSHQFKKQKKGMMCMFSFQVDGKKLRTNFTDVSKFSAKSGAQKKLMELLKKLSDDGAPSDTSKSAKKLGKSTTLKKASPVVSEMTEDDSQPDKNAKKRKLDESPA